MTFWKKYDIVFHMVTKKMTAKEARDNFTDLLGTVYYGKEPVIVEKQGRPFVVVINPEEYGRYKEFKRAAKKRIFEIIEEIQAKNKNTSYAQVFKDVTEAVEEVRKERYAKKRQTKSSN